jgi:His/Glu/Gln/Arg/opine family amino acid ABC transporter permease subunit
VQDLPIVTFYERRFPQLRRLGEPVEPGFYVGLTRSEDQTLLRALNAAILACWEDGSFPAVLDRYGLWNEAQRQRGLLTDSQGSFRPDPIRSADQGVAESAPADDWLADVLRCMPLLLQAAGITVLLAACSMPLAIGLGILIAVGRLYGPWWSRRPLGWYVEVVRGTPLVLQLFVIFFLLPELGLSLPRLIAGVLGLAINYSAYEAEIYRAGLQAIPRGQMEAALSLGMTRRLALRRIIIPQAFRIVIPPVMNDFIALFKDTAVCSVITIVELSKAYYIHAQSTGRVVELGLVTACWSRGWSADWPREQNMIELDDIHKRYRSTEVLRGVSLRVRKGEVSVLLGPSGGGKSTLLRMINGLETFDRGRIRFDELELVASDHQDAVVAHIRRRVGMVFQQFNLFPHLSVLDNVTEAPRHVLKIGRGQAEVAGVELLRRVGLADKLHARPHTLSGGQQQRVAIARALAMQPEAMLFDEPTSALDPRMTAEVIGVMADLARDGQTMIVVTHALSFARSVAHSVHVMHEGRIAESGPPEQIFESPAQDVTRVFLAQAENA